MGVNKKNQIVNKIQSARPEEFAIEEIDFGRGPYCMSFGFDLERYVRSIGSVGLINSPTVIQAGTGKVTPVTGYRRLLALRVLKQPSVFCRDLSSFKFSTLELFLLNLEENLATRRFNDVEKGMILNRLIKFFPVDTIVDVYMPLLGLASRKSEFVFYTNLENELNDQIKGLLVNKSISIQTARMLMSIEKISRECLGKLMADLKLNINKQRQLLEYLVDLSKIKDMNICNILDEKETRDLIASRNLNNPQKADALFRLFKSIRFPLLDSAEKKFSKRISRLNLPKTVRINHSPFFESSNYAMEILFRDGSELVKRIEELKDTKGLADITDPWLE